ncbi:MAG: SprT family protein [Bacilli bacterium]
MNQQQLQLLVEEISKKYFLWPFVHMATYNPRLKTTGGRYILRTGNIEVNPRHYERYGIEELTGIIKHELCHYHLHQQKRGYQHKDKEFKDLLQKVGAPRFCKDVRTPMTMHLYICMQCNCSYHRQRRINTLRYRCGKCQGQLKKVEKGG